MLFWTHLLLGIFLGLSVKSFVFGGNYLIFFFLVLLGSVLPDIDEKESKVAKGSGLIGSIISFFSQHRGFFHSLAFLILAVLTIKLFFNDYYAWALFLGLASHLLLDGMSRQGINWFYPFAGFKMKGWIKVGGWGEIAIQIILVAMIVWKVMGWRA